MIKINNLNPIKFISILCIIGIILLSVMCFYDIYKTRDYIKTTATITDNKVIIDYGATNNSKTSRYKYVEVKYDDYTSEYRVWTFIGKKEGKTTTIYYSKEEPTKVRDKFKIATSLMGIAFLAFFVMGVNLSKKTSTMF